MLIKLVIPTYNTNKGDLDSIVLYRCSICGKDDNTLNIIFLLKSVSLMVKLNFALNRRSCDVIKSM